MARFYENVQRSIVKSLTFRIIIICSDGIIVFIITHRVDMAIGIIIVRNAAAMILYYLHERFWNNIHWGKRKN